MPKTIEEFLKQLWGYYDAHGRDLPWRHTNDPYKILVSEIMLQQTQVARVIPKYKSFLKKFPNTQSLSKAQLSEVLKAWSGLGYNRRAKYLHEAARAINNKFPDTIGELVKLPGVGKNTAGAIMAYAYNKPAVFVETNVRTVYIHHFFADRVDVSDAEIRQLIEKTIDNNNPREFYWALMDYGTYLKATVGNFAKSSKHYSTQSKFEGSLRQVRGRVLKMLSDSSATYVQLAEDIQDDRLKDVLNDLQKEKMIQHKGQYYSLG